MNKLALLLAFVSSFALTGNAFALDFSGIQNWTGTGSNEAALVIDFDDAGPAYAWGYRFDGVKTGGDMLLAIAAADPSLDVTLRTFSFGRTVESIQYGSLYRNGFEVGTQGYFGYFVAENTSSQPTTWTSSQVGFDARLLSDDSWDGYSWAPNFSGDAPRANIVAAAPVPEPATFAALGLGAAALLRRRTRRS